MTLDKDRVKYSRYQVRILDERCKGCGFCIEFCPQKVLRKSAEMNSRGYHSVCLDGRNKCGGCNICAMICPEFALVVSPIKEEDKKEK